MTPFPGLAYTPRAMKKLTSLFITAATAILLTGNASANQPATDKEAKDKAATALGGHIVTKTTRGKASWYEIKCNGGTHTASGIPLRDYAMTAAHKTLPMGTKVRVTNLDNGKSAIVTITDRGPYIKGRIIDVTKGVAQKLGFINRGVVNCTVEVLKKRDTSTASSDA